MEGDYTWRRARGEAFPETQADAVVSPIPYVDPVRAFAPFRDEPMSLLLHGSGAHPEAHWSYLLTAPSETLILDAHDIENATARLRAWIAQDDAALPGPAPFAWGVAGFISYEAGAGFDEAMPAPSEQRLPLVALGRYDCVVAFDNRARQAFVTLRPGAGQNRMARIATSLGGTAYAPHAAKGSIAARDSRDWYKERVARLVARIRAGDLFQANLSRRFAGRLGAGEHPYDVFARLTAQSPAPFSAYMRLPSGALVSNSPERFVSIRSEGGERIASTSPIKGTRPRGRTPQEDDAQRAALLASDKDRAENIMIVDLMRNDLSRVCRPGSVRAAKLHALESFANVHHLVSTVEGALKPSCDALDLMRAAFPAGSITGAPKIKAMEMIRTLEGAAREANYGAIAWFGAGGAMDSSVLIRTAVCSPDDAGWSVSFRVGGGIVADSDPESEADETETKARALIAAICGARP